jgi:hypothetical protein
MDGESDGEALLPSDGYMEGNPVGWFVGPLDDCVEGVIDGEPLMVIVGFTDGVPEAILEDNDGTLLFAIVGLAEEATVGWADAPSGRRSLVLGRLVGCVCRPNIAVGVEVGTSLFTVDAVKQGEIQSSISFCSPMMISKPLAASCS